MTVHKASTATPRTAIATRTDIPEVKRETYDAHGGIDYPGDLVRREGDPATGDASVDTAHDNAKIVHDFYRDVLGRNSIDGKGMTFKSSAHAEFQDSPWSSTPNNAAWDGQEMLYGDGDGRDFGPFAKALDVAGHEITHGVTEATAGLDYHTQSGALNESWSDVMGELIQHWNTDKKAFATPEFEQKQDWLIGEDVLTPGKSGDGLRSMRNPGHGYDGDPQPGTMSEYKKLPDNENSDFGGVHINSGIPNKAAYEVATKIGGEKTAKIWYSTLTDYLQPRSQFKDAAFYTVEAAKKLYPNGPEAQAVADAWKSVGLTPPAELHPTNPGVVPQDHGHNSGIVPPHLQNRLKAQATPKAKA
jgi:Zn-dependent metalloprotease